LPHQYELLAQFAKTRVQARKRATPLSVELDGRSTGETILAAAQDCDLLIKGAYTQSRLRE